MPSQKNGSKDKQGGASTKEAKSINIRENSAAINLGYLFISATLFSFGWSSFIDSHKALKESKEPKASLWLQAGFDLFSACVGSLSFPLISLNIGMAAALAPYLFSAILAVNVIQGSYFMASSLLESRKKGSTEESRQHLKEAASQGFNLTLTLLSLRVNNAYLDTLSMLSTGLDFAEKYLYQEEPEYCCSSELIGCHLGGLVARTEGTETAVLTKEPCPINATPTIFKQINYSGMDEDRKAITEEPGFATRATDKLSVTPSPGCKPGADHLTM